MYIDDKAATVAQISNPVTNPHVDWMWNSDYYAGTSATYAGLDGEIHWQVRSKRKLHEIGDTLWMVLQPNLAGATNVTLAIHTRVLLLLP